MSGNEPCAHDPPTSPVIESPKRNTLCIALPPTIPTRSITSARDCSPRDSVLELPLYLGATAERGRARQTSLHPYRE